MKIKYIFIIIFCLRMFSVQCVSSQNTNVNLYQIDPLTKVLKERTYFRDEVDTIRVARGETASIQIVVKGLADIENMQASVGKISSGSSELTDASVGWVGYVRAGRSYNPPSEDIIRSASDYFPDPILTDTLFSIERSEIQPLWITVPIAHSTPPGLYKGNVNITGKVKKKNHSWRKDFYIRVYPVTLGKSPLFITNWSSHCNPASLNMMNRNQDVPIYSPLYWQLIEMHAAIMASHRQNVHRIYPVWNTQYTYENERYSFDFSHFDREAGIFDNVGALERIEGGHLAWRSGAWNDPFFVEVPLPDNEETKKLKGSPNPVKTDKGIRFVILPIEDARAQNFLNQFLPAFKDHLEQKGWLNRYMQHIADEPSSKNAPSYCAISNYVRKFLPGVKIIDAVATSKELAGSIDVWVPILDVLHRDYKFYQELQANGEEVWFYTCGGPRRNYANRFIEQPLIQTRYLHWINYKYNLTGYLHWGLNYWENNQLNIDASRNWGRLPAGDNCIIYPGYRKLYSSIRFEAMRDGIDDYQLLKMVEKTNPRKAQEYVNAIIQYFDEYDGSVTYFRSIRKKMLDLLSNYSG